MRLSLPRFARHLGLLLFATVLSGCASQLSDYYTLVKLALRDNAVTLTKAELREVEGSQFIKVRVNDRASVLLQLTFNEKDSQYWRSGDGALIRLHNGVITQTDGLDHNLYFTSNQASMPDPSTPGSHSWERLIDIEGVGYGLQVTSTWEAQGSTSLDVFDEALPVSVVVEHVTFPELPPYMSFNRSWQNHYYYADGVLVGTTQKLYPDGDSYDMVFLNRALASLDQTDNS